MIREFDYSANLLRVIPWQYQDAERLIQWLTNKQEFYNENVDQFFNDFQTDVFDIRTINDFGAVVWSLILDIPFIGNTGGETPNSSWGFGQFRKNYTNGNFTDGRTFNSLTIEQRRAIIIMRYRQLYSRGTIPEINQIMSDAFGDSGVSYCRDNLDMTISYVFEFTAEPWMRFAIETLQVLPRPSAVDFDIVEI